MTRIALFVAVFVMSGASHSEAALISITQVFHDLSGTQFQINGASAQTVNGPWTFTIETDTAAPNLGNSSTGRFAANIRLTQTSLGLNNEPLANTLYWWEQHYRGGFANASGSAPWTRTQGPTNSFGDPNVIDVIPTLSMVTASSGINWFANSSQLELQNGTTIHAVDTLTTTGQVSSLNASGSVPEPSTFTLLGMGAMGLFGFRRRRRRKEARARRRSAEDAVTSSD